MSRIRVGIIGAAGRMGSQTVHAVNAEKDMEVVGGVDVINVGEDIGVVAGVGPLKARISKDPRAMILASKPDVVVDFSTAEGFAARSKELLANKCRVVVGATGISKADLDMVKKAANSRKLGFLVAPNFAIGAVLMIKFAAEAARYMPEVEIIEFHHDKKKDAPSGTALYTAERISEAKKGLPKRKDPTSIVKLDGARGASFTDISLHSVRLPGFLAHQEVIFGGIGQTLTIRHDTINRESFMPGVILAIRRIGSVNGFVSGLENIL